MAYYNIKKRRIKNKEKLDKIQDRKREREILMFDTPLAISFISDVSVAATPKSSAL